MVKITAALALTILCACAGPALAGACAPLEYQEMKDMSVNELVAEACKAEEVNDGNFKQVLANMDATRVAKPFPNADENRDQCSAQIDRMLRIIKSKGVTEKLYTLCKQQAQGITIAAPVEIK